MKRAKGGPMDVADSVTMREGLGIVGNANQGGRRQVTIIDADVWERVLAELGAYVDPSARRANVMLRGVDLANSRGRILHLGECHIRIFNETKPCELMDLALPGLRAALYSNWAGGAFGEVVVGGTARVGDAARFADEVAR